MGRSGARPMTDNGGALQGGVFDLGRDDRDAVRQDPWRQRSLAGFWGWLATQTECITRHATAVLWDRRHSFRAQRFPAW